MSKTISIHRITIGQMIEGFYAGSLVPPEFQRDYVWRPAKAPKLLDSLYSSYPVGSILTWSTTERMQPRGNFRTRSPMRWIVDGQQRIRTLVKIMDHDLPVLFDARTSRFIRPNAATRNAPESTFFPVAEIWGSGYTAILRGLEHSTLSPSQVANVEINLERCRNILNIEVPQIHLEGHTTEEAVEAFQRINSQGVKLKAADIEAAELSILHSGFVRQNVQPFMTRLKIAGWDRVHLAQLFLACQVIAENKVGISQRQKLHAFTHRDLCSAWRDLEIGVERAIDFLKAELNITSMQIFPNGAMLMPLAALLSPAVKHQPKKNELVRWLIMVSGTRRYSKSQQERIDQDLRACFNQNPMTALNRNNVRGAGTGRVNISERNLDGALHDRYAIFLAFTACVANDMRDLFDGGKVSSATAQRHHIIPKGSVSKKDRRVLDNVANIAFIQGVTNRKISKSAAAEYLGKIPAALRNSQCIPSEEYCWHEPKEFMKLRAKLMARSLQGLISSRN